MRDSKQANEPLPHILTIFSDANGEYGRWEVRIFISQEDIEELKEIQADDDDVQSYLNEIVEEWIRCNLRYNNKLKLVPAPHIKSLE
ncbi:hypothetical protein [Nostoc sp.]|uniref:hypothetical protein n=1 Tax=Nostoc sp. TaxID=1180 RepID=UPI002FF55200